MVKKLLISTTIWGASYVNNFFYYTLPSLISKGNILDKYQGYEIKFLFLIEKKDLAKFTKNKILKKINIEYLFINKFFKNGISKYSILSSCQKEVLKYFKIHNCDYLMLFYPDSIFSENYVKACLKLIKDNKVVLSPGPLVALEEYKKYIQNQNMPYKKNNLINFTKKNIHPYYKSLINNDINAKPVNIFQIKNELIFNCYDLHISIIEKEICNQNINFDTIDGNYLSKIDFDLNKINYAKSAEDLLILSYESIFSNRPDFHFDNLPYQRLQIQKLYKSNQFTFDKLKKKNFLDGTYILSLGINKNYNILNDHINRLKNSIVKNSEKKKLIYYELNISKYLHFPIKYLLRKVIALYVKSPENLKGAVKANIQKNQLLNNFKINLIHYVYS